MKKNFGKDDVLSREPARRTLPSLCFFRVSSVFIRGFPNLFTLPPPDDFWALAKRIGHADPKRPTGPWLQRHVSRRHLLMIFAGVLRR